MQHLKRLSLIPTLAFSNWKAYCTLRLTEQHLRFINFERNDPRSNTKQQMIVFPPNLMPWQSGSLSLDHMLWIPLNRFVCCCFGRVLNVVQWGSVVKWEFIAPGRTRTEHSRELLVTDPSDNKFNYFLVMPMELSGNRPASPYRPQTTSNRSKSAQKPVDIAFPSAVLTSCGRFCSFVGNKHHSLGGLMCTW